MRKLKNLIKRGDVASDIPFVRNTTYSAVYVYEQFVNCKNSEDCANKLGLTLEEVNESVHWCLDRPRYIVHVKSPADGIIASNLGRH